MGRQAWGPGAQRLDLRATATAWGPPANAGGVARGASSRQTGRVVLTSAPTRWGRGKAGAAAALK